MKTTTPIITVISKPAFPELEQLSWFLRCITLFSEWGKTQVSESNVSLSVIGRYLAHLSVQAHNVSFKYTHAPASPASVRRPSVPPFTISNTFSSETAGPIKVKIYVELSGRVAKVYINGPMTKMAAMLIYD